MKPKEGLLDLTDATLPLLRQLASNSSHSVEYLLNVNLRRVKQNIVNAFNQKRIFDQPEDRLTLLKTSLLNHQEQTAFARTASVRNFTQVARGGSGHVLITEPYRLARPRLQLERGEFFMQDFKDFLAREENSVIFSACLWHVLLDYSFRQRSDLSEEDTRLVELLDNQMLRTIADTYLELSAELKPGFKKVLNKLYFDVVAQAVFYSLFYAFPKSRHVFNFDFKAYVFKLIAKLFKGCEVSPSSVFYKNWSFIEDWYLDLGAGNVLKHTYNGSLNSKSKRNNSQQGADFSEPQKATCCNAVFAADGKSWELQKLQV